MFIAPNGDRLRGGALPYDGICRGLRLQSVEESGGTLGMGGGGEDRAPVVPQNGQPIGNICGMIFSRFGREREVGAEEGAAKLGDLS
jgi:hypothetical protein